ncbi:MAG: hypothetical protein ACK5N8_04015 [Alphaproteobacteria bacterium]
MVCFRKTYLYFAILLSSVLVGEVQAQVLGDSVETSETAQKQSTSKANENPWLRNPRSVAKPTEKKEEVAPDWAKTQAEKEAKKYTPQTQRPTLDGVQRGHVSMVPIAGEKTSQTQDRFIFIYYSNFNIHTSMSGRVMCDVKFIVLSTLDQRINNLSFRLKWPSMETGLNYEGVAPNTETFYDYTLLGEGCYSMDKAPNIIVNRCRVKGMTSRDCASKIKWLRKQ